jgi:serine/threonine-protein kinase
VQPPDAGADRGDIGGAPDQEVAPQPADSGVVKRPGSRRKRSPRIVVAGKAGRLSVDSDPWSTVYLDGARLGTTPLWQVDVPAGRHRLRLVTSRGQSTERHLRVPAGGSLNLGTINLRAREP